MNGSDGEDDDSVAILQRSAPNDAGGGASRIGSPSFSAEHRAETETEEKGDGLAVAVGDHETWHQHQQTNADDIMEPSGLVAADRNANLGDASLEPGPSIPIANATDNIVITSMTGTQAKQRSNSQVGDAEVGAVQVDEQAPQLNRRFYLGLDRPSVRARNMRARQERGRNRRQQEADHADHQGNGANDAEVQVRSRGSHADGGETYTRVPLSARVSGTSESSSIRSRVTLVLESISFLIKATLVSEDEEEVVHEIVHAEPIEVLHVSRFAKAGKIYAFTTCLFFVLFASAIALFLTKSKEDEVVSHPTVVPSIQPSLPPSYDPRPTLEIVQTRGRVRCGLRDMKMEYESRFCLDLCRAVAAVIFGSPYNFEEVPVTEVTRFGQLNEMAVDLLLYGDTHTIEREVRERTTGAGFTFSSPFYYSGMSYLGNETFVRCAEEERRSDECSSLFICVLRETTSLDYVRSRFPSDFFRVGASLAEMAGMLANDTCNVIASDRSILFKMKSSEGGRKFILGEKLVTKEPLAIVTRNNDDEFSSIVDWVVNALFYGEERVVTKHASICQEYADPPSRASDLNFMNAVYCVGNYGEIYDGDNNRGMNRINDGTTGMIYATPFGDLANENVGLQRFTSGDLLLNGIRKKGSLNCGVVIPDGFDGGFEKRDEQVGMSMKYCCTLAAALFNANVDHVKFLNFSDSDKSSFNALRNGTIDVLAGGRIEKRYDSGGFRFSTPYYFGDEIAGDDVSFFSLVTHKDSLLFGSFVNCIVLATIYAQENSIHRENSKEMPFMTLFGSEFKWALRDAIAYSGSYDQIYKYFADNEKEGRGRNILNNRRGPQIHSFPGLSLLPSKPTTSLPIRAEIISVHSE